jgi:hypothetical protein
MTRSRRSRRLALALLVAVSLACRTVRVEHEPSTFFAVPRGEAARFHLRDGTLVSASTWRRIPGQRIRVEGTRYDIDRNVVDSGRIEIARDDIVLVTVTEREAVGGLVALGVISVASLGVTTYCAINPKSCFGSCPTFYVRDEHGEERLQAEGFSTSVARSLEADDVDLMPAAVARNGYINVTVRNEAAETHYIRSLNLEVVDGPADTVIHRDANGTYLALGSLARPLSDGNVITQRLTEADGVEHTPGSDGHDLAARSELTLQFPAPHTHRSAALITGRNSLMNTWVFYHLLALMGPEMPRFFSNIERGDMAALTALRGFDEALGGVNVSVRQDRELWKNVGTLAYFGPIASVTQAVAFDVEQPDSPLEVRLEFARAHWRFDRIHVAAVAAEGLRATVVAAEITEAVEGHEIHLDNASLHGEGDRLATLPGDVMQVRFAVAQEHGARGYFLRSRGYYYEWGREAWRPMVAPAEAVRLMRDPRGALRELAAAFRADESGLDAEFEASRIRRSVTP